MIDHDHDINPPEESIQAELRAPYSLTPEQVSFYQENGFIRLKNVFSKRLLDYFAPHLTRAVTTANGGIPADEQLAKDAEDPTYANAFKQVINIWMTDPVVRLLAFSPKLSHIATQLLAVPGVRIYHDQALFKEPGTSGHTPYHADQFYWPLSSDKTVTAWIPLQSVPVDMGPLEFVKGSHKVDLGRGIGIGMASDKAVGDAVAQGGYEIVGGAFEVGEVSFHAGWTFHRAGPNTRPNVSDIRRVYTVIYMDKDIRLTEPANDNQKADMERYLKGVQIGAVCECLTTPVVP